MEFIILVWSAIVVIIIVFWTSSEKFYNKETNRWNKGINLPNLKLEKGEEVIFKKFQLSIRLNMLFILGIILFASLWLLGTDAYNGKWSNDILTYMIIVVSTVIYFIFWAKVMLPANKNKYIKNNNS